MIRFFKIVLFFCCLNLGCRSEEKNENNSKKNEMKNVSELSVKQLEDWNNIYNLWLQNNFQNCLHVHDFKMDCMDCGNIILDVELVVSATGALESYEIMKTDFDCSNKTDTQLEALKGCLMLYFMENKYPESLTNTSFKTRIGRVTKC